MAPRLRGAEMPRLEFSIRFGPQERLYALERTSIIIGRDPHADLVVPAAWMEPYHLAVERVDDVLRIRRCSARAKVEVAGRPIGGEWELVDNNAEVRLRGPGNRHLDIRVRLVGVGPLKINHVPQTSAGLAEDHGALVITDGSPVPAEQEQSGRGPFGGPSISRERQKLGFPYSLFADRSNLPFVITVLAVVMIVLPAFTAMMWQAHARAAWVQRHDADARLVQDQLDLAIDQMVQGRYTDAQRTLDTAQATIARYPDFTHEAAVLADLRASPEMQYGVKGYVQVDSQWLPPEVAHAWQAARVRDDPKIAELEAKAVAARQRGDVKEALMACEEALAIIEGHPVKTHPRAAALTALRDELKLGTSAGARAPAAAEP